MFEKSHQVALIGSIFANADRVLVWLGDEDASLSSPLSPDVQLASAIRTTNPPWWRRAWVVQEFVIATQEPLACFGSCTMEWSEVSKLESAFKTDFGRIAEYLSSLRQSEGRDILSLSWISAQTSCQRPVDKIFSIVGLLSSTERQHIGIDYQKGAPEVFAEATYSAILASRSFQILALIRPSSSRQWSSGGRLWTLPSWVVDFTFDGHSTRYRESDARFTERVQSFMRPPALPWTNEQQTMEPKVLKGSHAPSTLTVSGLVFDRVQACFTTQGKAGVRLDRSLLGSLNHAWHKLYAEKQGTYLFTKAELVILGEFESLLATTSPYEALKMQSQNNLRLPTSPLSKCVAALCRADGKIEHCLAAYLARVWCRTTTGVDAGTVWGKSLEEKDENMHWLEYLRHLKLEDGTGEAARCDQLLVTRSNFIGFGSNTMQEGDTIMLPYGSPYPILLSTPDAGRTWRFRNFVYVFGIMDGKLNEAVPDLVLEARDFVLV